jgi:hypothetical protein
MDASWSREQVIVAIAKRFAPDERDAVLAALDSYRGDTPAGRARVQLAILEVAAGDAAKVREYAAHANVDFRDVLFWAEHQGDRSVATAPRPRSATTVVAVVLIVLGVRPMRAVFGASTVLGIIVGLAAVVMLFGQS